MAERVPTDGGAREWATAYATFLLRAAGQSARTLQLYEQVLGCVSRGQLSASTVRQSLSRFMEVRAGESASRLAGVSARFFSELMDSVVGHEPEAAQENDSADSETDLLPEFDLADPAGWFRQLVEQAQRRDTRAVQAHDARLNGVATGKINPSQLQLAVSGYYDRRFAERLSRTARICFDLLNAVTDLRSSHADEYLRGVLGMVKPKGLEGDLLLRLVAPMGETTSACLSLENTRTNRAAIRCAVTDVRRADGVGPAFAPSIFVSPDGLLLEPDQVANVWLSLRLDAAVYDPDAAYVGAVHVIRHDEAPVEIPLLITATAGERAAGINGTEEPA